MDMTSNKMLPVGWDISQQNVLKIYSDKLKEFGICIDKCANCKCALTSPSYQQNFCGTRYCHHCFEKMKPKYYCNVCKDDDPNQVVHEKKTIFEDKALMKDAERVNIKCPDCDETFSLSQLEPHAMSGCGGRWKNYYGDKEDQLCNIISPYEQCGSCLKECQDLSSHVCVMASDQACPYNCAAGDVKDGRHRLNASLDHLDKTWAVIKELKLSDCKKADNSTGYVAWMESNTEKIKTALNYNANDVQALRSELELLKKEIEEERALAEKIKTNMLQKTSELLNTNFDGTIMWRIDRFSTLKKYLFSQPFYTSRFGYKMCVLLYPKGDANAKEKAISLHLVIMKGNYDAMLRWPFKQKVTFTLVNQTSKDHVNDSFFPSDSSPSFSKPLEDMNPPAGVSSFIRLDEFNLNNDKYAKNDIVFIKCTVDCSDLHE